MLRVAIAVHEHDGDRPDPVRAGRPQLRFRGCEIQGRQHLAAGPDPHVDLDHPLVEHLGKHDAEIEEARPGLVADAKRVPEPPVDDEQGSVALALEQRVGGDGRTHLDRIDPPDGLAGSQIEDLPDPVDGGVPVVLGVVGEELVGDEGAVRAARDHIREGAAPIDPELPAAARRRSAAHRMLPGRRRKRTAAAARPPPAPVLRGRAELSPRSPPRTRIGGLARKNHRFPAADANLSLRAPKVAVVAGRTPSSRFDSANALVSIYAFSIFQSVRPATTALCFAASRRPRDENR